MKQLIVFLSILLLSVNGYGQSENAKRAFVKRIFKDLKKNRIESITDKFVDSIYIDKLLSDIQKKEPKLSEGFKKEKIEAKRKKAKKQLAQSLESAYSKLDKLAGGIRRARLVDIELRDRKSKMVDVFSANLQIEMEDRVAELRIKELTYDEENNLFFILSNKVRVRIIEDQDIEVETAIEEVVELPNKPAKRKKQDIREMEAVEEVEEIEDTRATEGPIRRMPKRRIIKQTIESDRDVIYQEGDDLVAPPPPPPPPREKKRIREIEVVEDVEEVVEMEVAPPPPPKKENETFVVVEEMPMFPGGEKAMYEFISKNVRYPELARESNVKGTVYVRFTVSKDGSLRDLKVLRGIGYGCDKEALRVVRKMPRWKPGRQRGKPVNVMFNLPFRFALK